MRPITISLDAETWELAKQKSNFSQWTRGQLRSERNKTPQTTELKQVKEELRLLQIQCDMYWNAYYKDFKEKKEQNGEEE